MGVDTPEKYGRDKGLVKRLRRGRRGKEMVGKTDERGRRQRGTTGYVRV